jgi:HYDIN/CFA65/VesB-like, Ig-like domain
VTHTPSLSLRLAAVFLLVPLAATAAITRTELAGNSLTQFPFFEYVKAFNVNAPLKVAIDPTRFPAIVGKTCNIFVVKHKSPSDWSTAPALVDVTPGGALTATFVAGTIQANTFEVAAASTLNADAGASIGVPYDVVLDCDQNGTLSDGDFIDGLSGEAGLYMVGDTTALGPHAVTEQIYNLDSGVASSFGIPGDKLGEDLYFPTNIAAMGRLPVVIISRGNGHDFRWYDHIGNHLASHGYVVMSHNNNTEPGPEFAATTTLGHTDAFLDQAEAGAVGGGALAGHLDSHRIVWIGHSRGAEGVAIAYNRLFHGAVTPTHYSRPDIRLISSMLPTDFNGTNVANPHDANYHLWTASGDSDVNGGAGCDLCQTFHLADRATGYKQSTIVQGSGHGDFHDEPAAGEAFSGPCPIGRANTHLIQLGYLLPLVEHYVEGNIPALDFLTRQYEDFHPIGVSTANPCIVVSNEYRNGASVGNFVIDDYQTQTSPNVSSSGGTVTFNVEHLTEGFLNDNNSDFSFSAGDPFNGATQGGDTDVTRGVVFDWTDTDRFYEWQIVGGANDFTRFLYLSLRGAQGTQHPNTTAVLGDLTFSLTLRDGLGVTSTINIGAYGGGLEEPYQRNGGWHNEMETIRIRNTDFLNNGAALNLTNIVAVRLNAGPSFGDSKGRIVIDDVMLTNDVMPGFPTAPKIQITGPLVFPDTCGLATVTATLDVCNGGGGPLTVFPITSSSPSFSVLTPTGGFPLSVAPGACFPLHVRFTPTGPGPVSATLTVPSDDPVNPSVNVTAQANVGQATIVTVMPDNGDFGEVCADPNKFKDLPLTINNSGSCTLTITSIASSSSEFEVPSVLSFPMSIGPGDSVAVPIRFHPTSPGAKSATISLSTNDPAAPNKVVQVSGTAPPTFVCHPPVFSSIDAAIGPTFGTGRTGKYTYNGSGRFLAPFGPGKAFGVQLQGEYMFYSGRQEGQIDASLLYRHGMFQFGAATTFKAANLRSEASAGSLSHATLTFDVLLPNVRFGAFGSKGLHETDVVTLNQSISGGTIIASEGLLHTIDQLGGTVQAEIIPNAWIDANLVYLHRYAPGFGDTAGLGVKYSQLILPWLAGTVRLDVNESYLGAHTVGTLTFGVTIGRWSRPQDYSNPVNPLGTELPRLHYELFQRIR